MARYAVIGVGGYIAPRHLQAIRDSGGEVIAALDPNDSVGIIDSYFPEAYFFTEFERFDRHLDKLIRRGEGVDYFAICSPNYLHDAHIRYAMRCGAHAICEKPLVVMPWNLEGLRVMEKETGKRVYSILQLRLHPEAQRLKKQVEEGDPDKRWKVSLKYITSRGKWYMASWKGDHAKSGGIAVNIGIHLFDLLLWVFGPSSGFKVLDNNPKKVRGKLYLERADVEWTLSIDDNELPREAEGMRSFRKLLVDDEPFEVSKGFTELHTESYKNILAGEGFGIDDAKPALDLAHQIRMSQPIAE